MREENMTKTIILGDLLSAGRIVIFNGRRTKAEVLNALIDRIAKEGDYGDRDDLEWAIFHRESLMSTGIGNGIATPHIILQNGDKTCMALGICKDGIADYESLDSKPVRIVFMIIAGKDQKLTHLKVLAAISSKPLSLQPMIRRPALRFSPARKSEHHGMSGQSNRSFPQALAGIL